MSVIQDLLTNFIAQSKTDSLYTNSYLKSYQGLRVKVSFGKGNVARVPWIAFTAPGHRISTGIYPAYLLFKRQNLLILAYGVGTELLPNRGWKLSFNVVSLEEYSNTQKLGLDKYLESFVHSVYDLGQPLDWLKIEEDLDNIIGKYRLLT